MQGIFQKENTDKALKYGIYRHLPTYEKIIRNLVSFYKKKAPANYIAEAFRLFFIQMSLSLYLLHDLLYSQYPYHFPRTRFRQNQ